MSKKVEKPKGEIIVVPQKKGLEPDFFKAMMEFQYGDAGESDAGFEKMQQLAQNPPKKKS